MNDDIVISKYINRKKYKKRVIISFNGAFE